MMVWVSLQKCLICTRNKVLTLYPWLMFLKLKVIVNLRSVVYLTSYHNIRECWECLWTFPTAKSIYTDYFTNMYWQKEKQIAKWLYYHFKFGLCKNLLFIAKHREINGNDREPLALRYMVLLGRWWSNSKPYSRSRIHICDKITTTTSMVGDPSSEGVSCFLLVACKRGYD